MKRRFFLLGSLAVMIAVAGSCKKFLDKKPHFLGPDAYYTNENEVKSALAGVYDMIGQEAMWGGQIPIRHNASTDESFFSYTTFPTGPFRYNYDASDTYVGALWRNLYIGIERANTLLYNLDKADMDNGKRAIVRGETLFLRGFYYFTLVQYYGDVPLKLVPSTSVNNVDIARTPSKEVYAQIIADMKDAETLVIMCAIDEKDMLMEVDPKVYFETDHYKGWPAVLVRLKVIGDAKLRYRLEQAWLQLGNVGGPPTRVACRRLCERHVCSALVRQFHGDGQRAGRADRLQFVLRDGAA